MRGRALRIVLALLALSLALAAVAFAQERPRPGPPPRVLRVCADPNNMPFSDAKEEGFENALARLVARDLGLELATVWLPQRRGFVRNTLTAGACDVMMGAPAGWELVTTTRPYYRSTYVFVSRADRALGDLRSFDDPRLRALRVGVSVPGNDYANTPPAAALARRGLAGQVVGFALTGDYGRPAPPARLVEAVAKGDVDLAVAWGPMAGWFAARQGVPLAVTPVADAADGTARFAFAIAMGVRKGNFALRDALDRVIARRHAEIEALLDRYGVPRLAPPAAAVADSQPRDGRGR